MATVRLVNRSRSSKRQWPSMRGIKDLCIGEIGYTVPWALDLDLEHIVVATPRGAATLGVKHVGVNDWEVWVEE